MQDDWVRAQDGQGVKNTGKEIINLARKLNVSQSVISRGNSINDFAENNDWSALREELEATQNEVSIKYQREAKQEYEQAQKRSIKAMIYAMRTDQMLFSWLGK